MFWKIFRIGIIEVIYSKFSKIAISIIVLAAISGGTFYYGYEYGYKAGSEGPKTVIVRGVADIEKGKEEAVDFSIFWEAWKVIKDKYVKSDELNNQDLVYGAISGLIDSLGDPNSVFMPPTDAKKFGEDIAGEFSGIGAEIGIKNDQLIIIAPLKNTPAERAGLRAADKILKIDDSESSGLNVDEAVKKIRGKKGTTVVLTILRNDWEKPREISIVRDIIQIPTLDWKMIDSSGAENKDGNIAYFHLYNFYENAPFLFYQSAIKTALSNPKGIILDLRNNPGGYLEASVNLAGWFLSPGQPVVTEEFRSDENQTFTARGSGLFKNMPMVILVNQGSASASEILAGALKDNRGIKIIGKKSFGKGTVQELQSMRDNSVMKITIAHWLTPKGQIIEKNGIAPDYEVELTDEDIKNGKDPQLEKAIEVLKEVIANNKN
ncbi:MAG: S41 family peptidase [Patescibacteria group bacterium]